MYIWRILEGWSNSRNGHIKSQFTYISYTPVIGSLPQSGTEPRPFEICERKWGFLNDLQYVAKVMGVQIFGGPRVWPDPQILKWAQHNETAVI